MTGENIPHGDMINRLQGLMPDGRISTDPARRAEAGNSNSLSTPGRPPLCILYPANPDELQAIIRFAHEGELNLTIASSTGIHRNGGVSSAEENILVDLSPWQTIDLIDRRNRVCRIEPGVTYKQLTGALNRENMVIPMPLAPRSGKSVLASVMDRTPSTWPNKQWDSGDPVASTEFFFGTGERFRSGAAGGPGTIEQQRQSGGAQKHPSGPSQTDFHRVIQGSQGTFGLVSWITIRTEITPSLEKTFLVGSDKLEELLPFVYAVQRGLLGEQAFILNRTAVAMLMANGDTDLFAEIQHACPAFICLQNVAGFDRLPQERLAYQLADITAFAEKFGLHLEEEIGPIQASHLLTQAAQPCGEIDWRDRLSGGSLSIFFLSTLDRSPAFRDIFFETAAEYGVHDSGIGIYLQPIVQNHACHIEFILPFDRSSEAEIDRLQQFEKEVVVTLMEAGAFFSRPYGLAANLVWDQNPANFSLVKKMKGIFDPHHVLQRGKWAL